MKPTIYRFRRLIDYDTCNHIVRTLLLQKLDYCNALFNGITKADLQRLQKLQNKCARLICQQPRFCHATPLLDQLHWLPVSQRIAFKTLVYVFKSLHGLCPQYIKECLTVRSRPDAMLTRSSESVCLEVPPSKKNAGDRALSIAAAQLWNKLPHTIRNAATIHSFRSQLKTHLYPK